MEQDTLRMRLYKLLQKSRQAYRLYSSVGRMPRGLQTDLSEKQTTEWRIVNAELIKSLSSLLENTNNRVLGSQLFCLCDFFQEEYRATETSMRQKQEELFGAAERGDFTKAAILSQELVSLKAKVEACQAAHHELDTIIARSKISRPPVSVEEGILPSHISNALAKPLHKPLDKQFDKPFDKPLAKIIPLRSREHR